ncbi:Elongator complex protein 5 [Catenaria anguillulae PL171]|uniref:Elongator complex protein 5 n=1 Tax=Catenaria anguillulae PL171 TaxID=765915 RepID=A0A1Y2HT17_9FUNG|nr:Elongator complex protein 5 [Catenaria anguillulae PL171]
MSVIFAKTHLERLLSGSASGTSAAPPGAIAVLDSLEQSALPLLSAFASSAASRSRPLLILCLEHSPHAWHSLLPASTLAQVVDLAASLPFPSATVAMTPNSNSQECWIKSHVVPHLTRFLASSRSSTGNVPASPLILIDSLHPLVPLYPTANHFARSLSLLLHLVSTTSSSATLLLPLTSHSPYSSALTYLTPTTLTVANAARAVRELSVITDRPQGDLGLHIESNQPCDLIVHLTSVKGGGTAKVVSESVRMTRSSSSATWTYGVFPPTAAAASVADSKPVAPDNTGARSAAADPTLGLSFNLKLTDKQRQAKDKVVLPHFKMQQFEEETGRGGGGPGVADTNAGGGGIGGVIHYELDLEDDFDDEDPDADLDL